MTTVRDATLDVLRDHGLTTMFSNPGSTEISLLAGLPDDIRFVLGLHEAAVVGMASGWAIGTDRPALAVLHTTAGLGNAVAALATARVTRVPLVVLVGQQDRRHLAFEPFLAGRRLELLAGDYPVWVDQPARAQDVPGAVARARHEAETGRGPALVVVPMDDWEAEHDPAQERPAPARAWRGREAPAGAVHELAALLAGASAPAIVAGAGADSAGCWDALSALAERLQCPVWQEPFGARAGFPQDHPLFAGHLPASRSGLREALRGRDVVLVVGTAAFRQYAFEPGTLVERDVRVAVVSADAEEVHRSPAALAVLAAPASTCLALAGLVGQRPVSPPEARAQPVPAPPPAPGEPLRSVHVLDALAARLPPDTVLLEEAPSHRAELNARLPARAPLGFLSAAMGGLGFALPAATGLRLALPGRPVVAVVGDGSSLYAIQSLWSAARYGAGALFVVLANGRYAIMDRLADIANATGPWPSFPEVDVAALARGFGCTALVTPEHEQLLDALDAIVPTLAERVEPVVLVVPVAD